VRFGGYSVNGALRMTNASPTLMYVSIRDNYKGIIASGSSNPIVNFCDIYKNSSYGIQNVDKTFTINAQSNWWGVNTGPDVSDVSGIPSGAASTITTSVDYSSYLTSGTDQPLAGDVSLSGNIQAFDASLILKWLADNVTNPLNTLQQRVADVTGDASISAYDGSLILQFVVGKIGIFPIEFNRSVQGPQSIQSKAAAGSIALTSGNVERGEQVTVTLNAQGLDNLYAAGLELGFNSEILTPISVQSTGLAQGSMFEYGVKEGGLNIFFASAEPLKGDGSLMTITFEANKDARGSLDEPITFNKVTFNETNASGQATGGTINVKGRPVTYQLNQNYPNPFNPSTVISYQVPNDGEQVRLEIYSLTGQLIRVLVDKDQPAGEYQIAWDGRSENGSRVATGMYLYRIKAGSFVSVKKMIMVK